jgi:Phage major capsid protein E
MSQLSLSQVRVIDPVLTQVAQGYEQRELIGTSLFPQVPVALRAGKIITFGKEDFMQYASARAPGENTKRIQYGYSSSTFGLVDYSLEGAVPIEVYQEGVSGANGWSIDHMKLAIAKTQRIMALRLEIAQATLATTAGNYASGNKVTLSGTSQWSDFSGTSDPIADVEAGKEAVRAAIGLRPNTLVLGAAVFAKLKQHPKIVDRLKYTGRDVATPEILASLFGVEKVLIGDAVKASDAGVFSDAWGKYAVLAYTVTGSVAEQGTPTFGYTYNLNGYPIVEQPYFDRNAKSWFVPVTRSEAPYIVGNTAGYLISGAVA